MEIRIGVQNAPRELALDCELSADDIQKAVDKAIKDGTSLALTGDKGHRVLIPAAKLAYVEIADSDARRVGFGAL